MATDRGEFAEGLILADDYLTKELPSNQINQDLQAKVLRDATTLETFQVGSGQSGMSDTDKNLLNLNL